MSSNLGEISNENHLRPANMATCIADLDHGPQAEYQERIYQRALELAAFLNSKDRRTVVAAAVALQQFAQTHECTIDFTEAPDTKGYEMVIERK